MGRKRGRYAVKLFLIMVVCLPFSAPGQSSRVDEVRERIRARLESAGIPPRMSAGQELIYASVALPLFYERRAYLPAWSDDSGPLGAADSMVEALSGATAHGLRPDDYHLGRIERTLEEIRRNRRTGRQLNIGRLVDLDLLLTDAFLIYGSHLLAGKVDPLTLDAEWLTNLRQRDMPAVLEEALATNRISPALEELAPPQTGYRYLKEALARYRNIAASGPWEMIPEGPKLKSGDQNARVIELRDHLLLTGDLLSSDSLNSDFFDSELEEAVRIFQGRHGLDVDGQAGPKTLAELNVPVEQRIKQIILNLERWRWLPQDLGIRHILINIASFELDVFEEDRIILNMKVVVGRAYRRTPVFSDNITYLVINPHWNVPTNIAVSDIIPLVKQDHSYLAKQQIRLVQGWGEEMRFLDPDSISWDEITEKNLTFRFRQDPGPANALGRIKFMFPNQFNVYLHDTPSRGLFSKTSRDFSSGCVRIEKPIELAEYLLRNNPEWNRQRIMKAIDAKEEKTVILPEPMPVHFLYWTAWADESGVLHFRKDIYNRDSALYQALTEESPKLD